MPSQVVPPHPALEGLWSFHNPVRVQFGSGVRQQLLNRLDGFARVLVVCSQSGRQRLHRDAILGDWSRSPDILWMDRVTENPGLHDLQVAIDSLKCLELDAMVGIGGGSALDTAKVLAIALSRSCHGHTLGELLAQPERPLSDGRIKLFALPTTSGTGSEVTSFATVWDHGAKKKYSLAGPDAYAHEALVDPQLTHGLPIDVTISTGLDAINQASESIWNRNANPITISLATRSLQLGIPALIRLSEDGESWVARSQLAQASLLAGLSISHTRTALCHSMSYPITAHFGVSHGLACAFTMPAVLEHCIEADDGRLAQLAKDLLGLSAKTSDLLDVYRQMDQRLQVRERVQRQVPDSSALVERIDEMFTAGRADNCIAPVNPDTLREILEQSWNGKTIHAH